MFVVEITDSKEDSHSLLYLNRGLKRPNEMINNNRRKSIILDFQVKGNLDKRLMNHFRILTFKMKGEIR